jgi:hypothetical protein
MWSIITQHLRFTVESEFNGRSHRFVPARFGLKVHRDDVMSETTGALVGHSDLCGKWLCV